MGVLPGRERRSRSMVNRPAAQVAEQFEWNRGYRVTDRREGLSRSLGRKTLNKRLWVECLFPRQGALNEGSGALSCRGAGGFVWSCALQDLPH